jgi:carbamoyltransferase
MWVLGIAKSHNGAVALIHDGEVVCAIQAERISRVKRQSIHVNKDTQLVSQCVEYCLRHANIRHSDIQSIAISTPFNFTNIECNDLFNCIGGVPNYYEGTFYVPHHYSHMEYILHYSHLSSGIVLIVDGNGSKESERKQFNISEKASSNCISHVHITGRETVSAYWFDGHQASLIYRFSPQTSGMKKYGPSNSHFLPSIGHYWQWASLYCCGSRAEAGKVMGLAASGDPTVHEKLNILSFQKNGLITLDYTKLFKTFSTPNLFNKDLSNNKHYADIAAMVQNDTVKCLMDILHMLKRKYPTDTLYYAGGVALNVVANEKIIRSGLFKKVILNGSAEDNGTAIGAALAASNVLMGKRIPEIVTDYYGRTYANDEILSAIKKFSFPYEFVKGDKLYDRVASLISDNRVVAWFQGRSEFGPRALGNRSILANPTSLTMKYILDLHMKQRDRYRPYAPAVLEEHTKQYFDLDGESPVMMREGRVLDNNFPAITHVDGSARVQTVTKKGNERFYKLIEALNKVSGFPVILNTSFNLPGEPIVETPYDAIKSFSKSRIEYLCIGNYILREQIDR